MNIIIFNLKFLVFFFFIDFTSGEENFVSLVLLCSKLAPLENNMNLFTS